MRKNKMMRIASVLLVAVLLSTSVISGTFAKYTTSSTGSDTARVAYWGWNAEATIDIDLFDRAYANNAVLSSGDVDGFTNVIAPGTSKTTTFAFGYKNYQNDKISAPEVAYEFTVAPDIDANTTSLDDNPNFWWTLQKPGDATATKYSTAAALMDALKALSGEADGTKIYAAGQLPTAFTDENEEYIVGWEWDFTGQDATDTAMGNAQTLTNVTFSITITATQVEPASDTTEDSTSETNLGDPA